MAAQRLAALSCLLVCIAALELLGAPKAAADVDSQIDFSVTVNEEYLGDDTVMIGADHATRLVVRVQNLSPQPLDVDSLQLRGTVLGLTFFDYDTRVNTTVPARGSANWTVDLDTRDLDGRATGLLPIEVTVRGADLAAIATTSGVAEARGSLISVYGLFGLGLIVLMGLLWAVALLPLGRHALPSKPWQRGLRFVPAGCGVGLFSVFALSVLQLLAPSTATDFVITLGSAAVCFGIGYLSGSIRTRSGV